MANDTGQAALDAALAAFEARYQRYLDEIADAKQRTARVRRAATIWSQRRPFADDPIHAQALAELRSLADEVTAALGDAGTGGPGLGRVTRLVLSEKRIDVAEYWPLVALEGLAKPWLAGLPDADLQAIAAAYAQANPRSQCLPNQRELRKEFERLLARK